MKSELLLPMTFVCISWEIVIWWMPQNTFADKPTLVQAIAKYRQQTNTWANSDRVLTYNMMLMGQNKLNLIKRHPCRSRAVKCIDFLGYIYVHWYIPTWYIPTQLVEPYTHQTRTVVPERKIMPLWLPWNHTIFPQPFCIMPVDHLKSHWK